MLPRTTHQVTARPLRVIRQTMPVSRIPVIPPTGCPPSLLPFFVGKPLRGPHQFELEVAQHRSGEHGGARRGLDCNHEKKDVAYPFVQDAARIAVERRWQIGMHICNDQVPFVASEVEIEGHTGCLSGLASIKEMWIPAVVNAAAY